jgi:hypothetical protein
MPGVHSCAMLWQPCHWDPTWACHQQQQLEQQRQAAAALPVMVPLAHLRPCWVGQAALQQQQQPEGVSLVSLVSPQQVQGEVPAWYCWVPTMCSSRGSWHT